MKTKKKPKTDARASVVKTGPRMTGTVVSAPIDSVKPNDWNPNVFTEFEQKALAYGMKQDGWLASHSLLIWRTDEKGKTKNLILDGEHRWTAAKSIGFTEGPMVFLDGLTLAQAKAMTVKTLKKRGEPDDLKLSDLLKSIQADLGDIENVSLDMGIEEEKMMALLADVAPDIEPPKTSQAGEGAQLPAGHTSHVRMQQLFFTPEQQEEYTKITKALAAKWTLPNATEVVLEALRRVSNARSTKK